MGVKEVKHEVKLAQWRQRIAKCRSSGESVRQWCRENQVHPTTYYRWERELFGEIETGKSGALVPAENRSLVEQPLCAAETGETEPEIVSAGVPVFKPVAVVRIGSMELSLTNGVSPRLMRQLKELMPRVE